jgi:hypothetical protein
LSAGLLAAVAGTSVTAGVPPTRFIEIALRALDRPTAAVDALASGVSPAMIKTVKAFSAFALAAGVFVGIGMSRPDAQAGPKPVDAKGDDPPAAKSSEPAAPPEFAGQVLDPSGKPVPGAKLFFLYYTPLELAIPERATTDADGKFRFNLKADELDRSYAAEPWKGGYVVARADGFGLGWEPSNKQPGQLAIHLPKDDKPLTGRIVNLEGKPIAGLTARVTEWMGPLEGKDLSGLIDDLKKRQSGYDVLRDHTMGFEGSWIGRDVGTLFPTSTTDADGRFTIPGIGTDRMASIRFEGAGTESRILRVLTREAETVTVPEWKNDRSAPDQAPMTFVGSGFTYALAPGRTVNGIVVDKATGKPIPGAKIVSDRVAGSSISGRFDFRAEADRDGKFTIHGLPLSEGSVLRASPPAGQPYLLQLREVPTPSGTNPAPMKFELTRGVELTVTVIDPATKKPVPGNIEYFTFPDNPAYVEAKGFTVPYHGELESTAGRFRVTIPSGPGLIAFRASDEKYPVAVGAEKFKDKTDRGFIQTVPHLCHPVNFTALAGVEPKPGDQAADLKIELEGGKKISGTVVDPDGKPLTGVLARGLKSAPQVFGVWEDQPLAKSTFEAVAVDPKRPRSVVFFHRDKKLAGSVRLTGEEKGPVEVKLEPWATITGRLVDADGKPMANIRLGFFMGVDDPDPTSVGDLPDREIRTDAAGRFTVSGFAPGLRYNLAAINASRLLVQVLNGTQFKAGETKDLGDVAPKPGE